MSPWIGKRQRAAKSRTAGALGSTPPTIRMCGSSASDSVSFLPHQPMPKIAALTTVTRYSPLPPEIGRRPAFRCDA
jgi:hypothetical protein